MTPRTMNRLLVTGCGGLIGSEVVSFFAAEGAEVHGIDNNLRADFFGPAGDTTWNTKRLQQAFGNFHFRTIDIRERATVSNLIKEIRPKEIVHTAAQPSHDLAASRPFDDFDVNGVLNDGAKSENA
jgi:CDP-paratose 2-epimerase